jgi:outer membrane lipoprotein
MKILLSILLLFGLSACSSTPEAIRKAPTDAPGLAEVRQQPERYLGSAVRWGGTLIKVSNLSDESHLEIVARELSRGGEPHPGDQSEGRFIAVLPGFVDPAIYTPGRLLTVRGLLQGSVEQALGELDYRYPLVAVDNHYLWPEIPPEQRQDMWHYNPWYPYGYPYLDPFGRPYPWHISPWPTYPW